MRFSLIPFLVLLLPVMEIAGFIVVGQKIGVLATLGLIFLTAIAGAALLRFQGFSAFRRLTRELETGQDPGPTLVDGFMIVLAGMLLILPGFITDIAGFLLLLPPVRHGLWRKMRYYLKGRMQFSSARTGFSRPSPNDVVDLDRDQFERSSIRPDNLSRRIGKDKP